MTLKLPLVPVVTILTVVSCLLALTVLIAAAKFHSNVKTFSQDAMEAQEHKAILKGYLNSQQPPTTPNPRTKKLWTGINYGQKLTHPAFAVFHEWNLLDGAICEKYRMAPAYLFYAMASVVLCLCQVGVALWCAYVVTLKFQPKILESIWMSRALESHMILYALSLLLFNFMNSYSNEEEDWIAGMKGELRSHREDYGKFTCHHSDKKALLVLQIINLVFLGLKIILILIYTGVFSSNWNNLSIMIGNRRSRDGLNNSNLNTRNERSASIFSLKSVKSIDNRYYKGNIITNANSNKNPSLNPNIRKNNDEFIPTVTQAEDENDWFFRKKSL